MTLRLLFMFDQIIGSMAFSQIKAIWTPWEIPVGPTEIPLFLVEAIASCHGHSPRPFSIHIVTNPTIKCRTKLRQII